MNKKDERQASNNNTPYKMMTAKAFIKEIKNLMAAYELLDKTVLTTTAEIKFRYQKVKYYFDHPDYVRNAAQHGGMRRIYTDYQSKLFQISTFLIEDHEGRINGRRLSDQEAEKGVKGFNLLAQLYKVKRAYTDISKGKKFKKAGMKKYDKNHPISQENPIKTQSKQNIRALITELRNSGGIRRFGLKEDEQYLFDAIFNLPFKLQHATNYYYPIRHTSSLDSYTERKRYESSYVSPFSTKGNVNCLGNDGFVFFRTYVDSVNSSETRYGDSNLIFDLSLLYRCGWVSLHDQLKPFSTKGATCFFQGSRLLRKAKTVSISNNNDAKTLYDGLRYEYRVTAIQSYKGKSDTQKSFGQSIQTANTTRNFLQEIFYAEDILLGITLSVIRELRFLSDCNFRRDFLTELTGATDTQRVTLLGDLIKQLYRIEAKYPVAVRIPAPKMYSPIASSGAYRETQKFLVSNPDGDGRFNKDLSVNQEAFNLGEAKLQRKLLRETLSNLRQQQARFKSNKNRFKDYTAKIEDTTKKINKLHTILDQDKQQRQKIIDYITENYDVKPMLLEKIHSSKLELINDYYLAFLDEGYVSIKEVINISYETLLVIAESDLYSLIKEEFLIFKDLIKLPFETLAILTEFNIRKPLEEGTELDDLLNYYNNDPDELEVRCCDDFTEFVAMKHDSLNSSLLDYLEQQGVDWDEILSFMSEDDSNSFKQRLIEEDLMEEISEIHSSSDEQDYDMDQDEVEMSDGTDYDEEVIADSLLLLFEEKLKGFKPSDPPYLIKFMIQKLVDFTYKPEYGFVFEETDSFEKRFNTIEEYYTAYRLERLMPKQKFCY